MTRDGFFSEERNRNRAHKFVAAGAKCMLTLDLCREGGAIPPTTVAVE